MIEKPSGWLPPGKKGAVYFTLDDVHPARATDCYDAGGDLAAGALGHLEWLLDRHPQLRVTIFLTADWREISPFPTRKTLARIPFVRDRVWLAKRWPKGTMRLDRHPAFVRYLQDLPRTDLAYHGLHHCHEGLSIPVEFQNQPASELKAMIREIGATFARAGIDPTPGICPPGWNAPPALLNALIATGLDFLASSRDVKSPIVAGVQCNQSGLKKVPLIEPSWLARERIVHFPSNFDATTPLQRARDIIDLGGFLGIKVHIIKQIGTYVARDGLDVGYRNYLDATLSMLEDRYGDDLWWTTMGEVAAHAKTLQQTRRSA